MAQSGFFDAPVGKTMIVTGLCGTPKFRYATALGTHAVINLDNFTHGPGWAKRPASDILANVERAIAKARTVMPDVCVVGSWHDPTSNEDYRVVVFEELIKRHSPEIVVLSDPTEEQQARLLRKRALRREAGMEATWGPNCETGSGEALVAKQARYRAVMETRLNDLRRRPNVTSVQIDYDEY